MSDLPDLCPLKSSQSPRLPTRQVFESLGHVRTFSFLLEDCRSFDGGGPALLCIPMQVCNGHLA